MSADKQFKSLLKTRTTIKANVTRLINYFSENTVEFDFDDVETRKFKLDEYYEKYSKLQIEIEVAAEEANLEDIVELQEEERATFEEQYFKCARLINQKLRAFKSSNFSASSANRSEMNANPTSNVTIQHTNTLLPKIEIRSFDGNPIEWCSFRDSFQSLVHNDPSIPTVQKFYLLKNSLRGSLTTIIEPLTASEENYNVAWDLLKQRCDKPRQIIQGHLKSLLELPDITRESPNNIRILKERALMHVNALRALKEPVNQWDSILVYVITQKLDKVTRRTWERTLENSQRPTFEELISFLNKQERGDDSEPFNDHSRVEKHTQKQKLRSSQRVQSFVGTQKRIECNFCKGSHNIYHCDTFLKLSASEKYDAVKNKQLCVNCLRSNHTVGKCLASGCKRCNKRHNTLLHFTKPEIKQAETTSKHEPVTQNEEPKNSYTITHDSEVLLGTARIKILDKHNKEHECRVLLDGCSQSHFISERLAERLQLSQERINLPFAGLGQLTTQAQYRVKTKIKSRNDQFEAEVEFVALPTITGLLPSRKINRSILAIPRNIRLADPDFDKPAEIEALIGTTLFYKLLSNGQIQIADASDLILQKTLLGWIVTGEVKRSENYKKGSCHLVTTLDNQLTRFWEIEEIPHKKHLSIAEVECEKLFSATTTRNSNGRYIVRLPFNENKQKIGNSYSMALRRLKSLERKLTQNPALRQQYIEFLREYHELGHMRDITSINNEFEGYYIPHHSVVKEANITTKVRVVFDASAKSTSTISLNDSLMTGPTIQDDLVFMIIRFRIHNVVLTADLQKMYRQIEVNEADAIYQKILWREREADDIRVFLLNTVTQGTASAPFLAARTLHQLAEDEGNKYPLAASSLKNDFYVDDLLAGASSIEQALLLKKELISLLHLGGFTLHKWASNKIEVLESPNDINQSHAFIDRESKKLLGIHWIANEDVITYSVNSRSTEKRLTKRSILSEIAQLFDPLGLLGPIIIIAKLIMQELWKAKLDWDESVPQVLHTRWTNFKQELYLINNMKIKRQIVLPNATDIQLHGFCDASEQAYGACVYLRSRDEHNNYATHLICAKSRVAPVSTMTIPRLELCAAYLLSKLIITVKQALKLKFNKINLWSDSTIVLHWIRSSPHTLKTFVANRVAQIQAVTRAEDWNHVLTEENPADYISRGQLPSNFIKNLLWLHGPHWLSQPEITWKISMLENITVPEQRVKASLITHKRCDAAQGGTNDTFERFSSIHKLNWFVAFCHRAVLNRNTQIKLKGDITVQELKDAHNQILKITQTNHFAQEIKRLTAGETLRPNSELLSLSPFLDANGIIRVGGRLKHSTLQFSKKHPILIPRNNHITKLIILDTHIKYWHAGVHATLNAVRQNYWPINGKNITRHILHNCVRCSKSDPRLLTYTMGDLPKARVTQTRPFENVGLDYCGPFLLKERKFRNKIKVKAYVAVLVCFVTKAIHLELATDLTTETCLHAIKRFIARRGKPKNIYSDNATNFTGAKNEILKIKAFLLSNQSNKEISHQLNNEGIKWHFSPPRTPHFGGLWEAAVKSFKHHLYRTLGDSLFTYEQFNTCIVEIESILNSRPLTPLSSDPNDLAALTPAHFLIGDNLKSLPENDLQNMPINRLSMWQRIQKIKQHFWQRWHKEYLNELRTRSKWHQGDDTKIKVGTLVTIKENDLPPRHWSLGRIVALHPGPDNIIRIATIKTQTGEYKRCIRNLAPLPIEIADT